MSNIPNKLETGAIVVSLLLGLGFVLFTVMVSIGVWELLAK